MANDFYQHSGWPGTRAKNASASWRSEYGLIEKGFDKLPGVSTANLFAVTDGSALVGKTAVQSKVILSLSNVPNLDTTAAVAHTPLTNNPHSVTKAQVGLSNVPNLDTTAAVAHTSLINNPHSVTKAQVGLGDCDNTSDAGKPISTMTQSALDLKAPLASPLFTGSPAAPTITRTAIPGAELATTTYVRQFFTSLLAPNGYQFFAPAANTSVAIVLQWGSVTTSAAPGTEVNHSTAFPISFSNIYSIAFSDNTNDTGAVTKAYTMTPTGFRTKSTGTSVIVRFVAVGSIVLT